MSAGEALDPEVEIVAEGLAFPEGPCLLPDGTLLVAEVAAGRISHVDPATGTVTRWAETGGGPNGLALGPDGAVYVCNNGGLSFTRSPRRGWLVPGHRSPDAITPAIQRVDAATGAITTICTQIDGHPLSAPNDLTFDRTGRIWFTDHGATEGRRRHLGAVHRVAIDGTDGQEVIFPLETPNGIGMSPDGMCLYVAETTTGSLWAWDLDAHGDLATATRRPRRGARLVRALADGRVLDSLAVDAEGNVHVGTLGTPGAITVTSSLGAEVDEHEMPDPFPTNVCFGPPDQAWVYVTLSASGRLARIASRHRAAPTFHPPTA